MDIIAHRGASAHAPENTLAAFRLAWEHGADGIEMDVHLSRDGRTVVHHDPAVWHAAGRYLDIAASDSTALRRAEVGLWRRDPVFAEEPLPFLDEVLATVPPGGQVVIDIKSGPEIVPALGAVLAERGSGLRALLVSLRLDTLLACLKVLPQFPGYLVVHCEAASPEGGFAHHALDCIDSVRGHGLAGLDPDYRGISPEFAAAVRAAGLKFMTWAVNEPAAARRLQELGLDAVTTACPREIRETLTGIVP